VTPFDKKTTIGVIQARVAAERLPGKILAPLAGVPLLARLWTRIAHSRGIREWWLATSDHPSDDVIEAWGFELGLRVHRGAQRDVLSHFLAVAEETGAEWLVRVRADDPFLDAGLIERLLEARDEKDDLPAYRNAALIRQSAGLRAASPRLPLGYGAEVVRTTSLAQAARTIPKDAFHHRVHVTTWLARDRGLLEVPTPEDWPDRGGWRWTVDTYQDLAMARSAFRLFGSEAATIDYPAMVARLDAHPEIPAMNRHPHPTAMDAGGTSPWIE
jgi:spore coat polysaccharide biosynthesis protein SpsF (cytidylyltransferase family)